MRNQKGSVMVETVFACMILLLIFAGMTEIVFLVRDEIGVIRVAREGAREAALSGNLSAGTARAYEVAAMTLLSRPRVEMTTEAAGGATDVICRASYAHYPFFSRLKLPLIGDVTWGVVNLSEEARYHFRDYAE